MTSGTPWRGSTDPLFGARWSVVLIEPPEVSPPVEPFRSPGAPPPATAPAWNLLCLRAYLLQRAGYHGRLVDTRLFTDPGQELVEALGGIAGPYVAVVHAPGPALDPVAATLETIKRHFPSVTTVVCGEGVARIPGRVGGLAGMDYALCGDPEPVLRNLVARLDGRGSLDGIPGLWRAGYPEPAPVWVPDTEDLFLWEAGGIAWAEYRDGRAGRAHMRLTRGAGRGGLDDSPLRKCSLEQAAGILQHFGPLGIGEVLLDDPPVFWATPELEAWCETLRAKNNDQPWGLRLLPAPLSGSVLAGLEAALCTRVDFICPAPEQDVLARFDFNLSLPEFRATVRQLTAAGIACHFRFSFGSPASALRHAPHLDRILQDLGQPCFTLEAVSPEARRSEDGAEDFSAALALVGQALCKCPRRWWGEARGALRRAFWTWPRDRLVHLFGVLTRGARLYPEVEIADEKPRARVRSAASPRGFRGWLLFFCVLYAVVFPLWYGRLAWLTWSHARGGWYADGAIRYIAMIEYTWIALVTLAGMKAGWLVWRGYPGGRQRARAYLLFRAAGFAGCYLLLRLLFQRRAAPETWMIFQAAWSGQLAREGLLFALWWLYFLRSGRVRATYGNLFRRRRFEEPVTDELARDAG